MRTFQRKGSIQRRQLYQKTLSSLKQAEYNILMRRALVISLTFLITALAFSCASFGVPLSRVQAQTVSRPSPTPLPVATASATPTATEEAHLATASAAVVQQKVEEKKEQDITEGGGQIKSRLRQHLEDNPPQPLNITNFVQHAIRAAVEQGVPSNVLVLLLLFPVVASLIAASRHIIGLEGFGVYTPAVLAVALLSTGIITGLVLFVIILIAAMAGRALFRTFHLQYLPRTALILWLVSLTVFGILLISPYIFTAGINLFALSIFPILVLILLSENFIEAQLSGSQYRAFELTAETMFLAVVAALFMQAEAVQFFVIVNPEMTILSVLIVDILVGRFTGLRLAEYLRFKPILDPEE